MKIEDFANTDFKDFSLDDTGRSIPNVIDGFKESQRKAIFGLTKRSNTLIKVAQAAGHCSKESSYHHGEKSMEDTIVKLAQNFTGSNNINLLEPEGQFGSRLSPESAASRYIFTKLSDKFFEIYKKDDNLILDHKEDDGDKIEPHIYYPIIPMVLVNGSQGIGTGYASRICNYNPKDIARCIKNIINGKSNRNIVPYYSNFKGSITRNDEDKVIIKGILEKINTTTIKITELPVGTYLDKYKEHLNKLEDIGFIKEYEDNSTEDGFDFTITCPRSTTSKSLDVLYSKFKLVTSISENLTLWTENNKIKIFKSPLDIIKHFVEFRLSMFERRKESQLEEYDNELDWYENKIRFINYFIKNPNDLSSRNKKQLVEFLENNKFKWTDRLINIPMYALTKDEVKSLENKIKNLKLKIKELKGKTGSDLYLEDLSELNL